MTSSKKAIGRPKGSEKDDNAVLAAIADRIVSNPALRPTTAMRQLRRKATDAEIRRWQSKWKDRGETLLADASARAEARARREAEQASAGTTRRMNLVGLAAMGGLLDTPAMRMARGLNASPAMKAIEAYRNSPTMRLMREIENSPTMRLIRQMEDSGIMRMVRQQQQMAEKFSKFGNF